ncbi:transcription antiterminator [Heyndrickxia coagulans]|uniref:BglG family transcription antiterminator n=1 Tax=Heyndrickxia coagulans TaxID=1398 RepID=UPI0028FBBF63|nr:transcription antiterminator [Heyndrickxia coagulans]MDT9755011.1 transcription antiterminator [Heyndrickxia coagulans]
MISNRQKQILWLLQKSDGPLNAKAIGERLGISDRTVREEIRQIQQKSDELGVKLKVLRGKGYLLEKVDYRRLLQLEENGLFGEQEERVKYILKRLLLEKEYVRLEDLEADMYVSKSTLHTDLKKVRKILKKYDLTLANRPHYGTKVEGGEFRKRLCLADSIFGWQNKPGQQNTPFNQDLFQKVKQILIRAISKYRIRFSNIELQNLATHITLACKRIEDGFTIEPLPFHFKEPYTFERKVAKEITGEVEKISGIPFPPAEMDYILVHLLGTKLISKHIARQVSDEIDDIVNAILRKLKIQFHWDFSNDKEFRNGLTLHLQTSLNRMKYKMNIRNPLLNEMKTKFPIAFEGAVAAGECIEAVIHKKVNEDEISYLAIHIAIALERMRKKKRVLVVCTTGVGSAKILSYQLATDLKMRSKLWTRSAITISLIMICHGWI